MSNNNNNNNTSQAARDSKLPRVLAKALRTHSFATLATVSPKARPHNAGVVYDLVDGQIWIHTMRTGRKGRNIADNPHVGVSIPYRRLPVGPPYTLQFQGLAEIIALDDPEALAHHEAGRLKSIAGHGAMEMTDACFVRISPTGAIHSFGAGVRLLDLIRDPLGAGARSTPAADVLAHLHPPRPAAATATAG